MGTTLKEVQILCKIVQRDAEVSKQYPRVSELLQSLADSTSNVLQKLADQKSTFLSDDPEFESLLDDLHKELTYLSVLLKDNEPIGFVKMVVHATVHREKLNRASSRLNNLHERETTPQEISSLVYIT